MTARKLNKGFTLLELLVALTIFSLISVTVYSSLTSMITTREHLKTDSKQLQDFFVSELNSAVTKGVTLKSAEDMSGGFKVSVKGGTMHHDFSSQAIADALCQLGRPRLAEIIKSALEDNK